MGACVDNIGQIQQLEPWELNRLKIKVIKKNRISNQQKNSHTANSYTVGLGVSKSSISDPLFIRVCSLFLCPFWGCLIRGSRAGESRLKTASSCPVLLAGPRGSAMSCLLCASTSSSRLFREQSVRLVHGEPTSASASRLWR